MAVKENIFKQLTKVVQMVKLEKDPHAAFSFFIEGQKLTYTLEDDMKYQFLALAVDCASVICCRVSHKQKALVIRLFKEGTRKAILAIGDGANDFEMIQEADIGITGVEEIQKVKKTLRMFHSRKSVPPAKKLNTCSQFGGSSGWDSMLEECNRRFTASSKVQLVSSHMPTYLLKSFRQTMWYRHQPTQMIQRNTSYACLGRVLERTDVKQCTQPSEVYKR